MSELVSDCEVRVVRVEPLEYATIRCLSAWNGLSQRLSLGTF